MKSHESTSPPCAMGRPCRSAAVREGGVFVEKAMQTTETIALKLYREDRGAFNRMMLKLMQDERKAVLSYVWSKERGGNA